MADFPAHVSILSYNEQPQLTVRRTPFEGGYNQQAKRFSNLWMDAQVSVLFTKDQYETYLTWYRDSISNGSASFNFPDFKETGSPIGTISARIVNGQFQSNPLRDYYIGHWVVNFTIEYLRS